MTDEADSSLTCTQRVQTLAGTIAPLLEAALGKRLRTTVSVCPRPQAQGTSAVYEAQEPTCSYLLAWAAPGSVDVQAAGRMQIWPPLAQSMIDLLLGGSGSAKSRQDAPLTDIDRRLLRRVVNLTCASLARAWPGPVKPRIRPASPGLLQMALPEPREPLLSLVLEVRIGPCCGPVTLWLPQDLLPELPADAGAQRPASAEISVDLEETLTAQELAQLREGDVLATDAAPDREVIVRIDGQPKFAARLGQYNAHRAITITRKL